ncbi:MAG: hypothetical protein PHI02_03845 [Sulfurovaceae bacterium]|nr:hypothetical protein [Sulfurovaceae bacterium]
MDQIKKRLEIIKIAIFMSDDETIRLQLLKLEYFQGNEQLDKIISLLKNKNYGQVQVLISEYLNNSEAANKKDEKENEDTLEYSKNDYEKKSVVDEFGMLKSSKLSDKHGLQSANQNIQQDKPKDSITSYVVGCNNFELSADEIEKIPSKKQTIKSIPPREKVDFSDIFITSKDNKKTEPKQEEPKEEEIKEEEPKQEEPKQEEIKEEEPKEEEINFESLDSSEELLDESDKLKNEILEEDLEMLVDIDIETSDSNAETVSEDDLENKETNSLYDKKYSPVSDIFHKFQNIALFHIEDKNYTLHKSSANWMHRISKTGYKEIEILKISKYIQKLKETKQNDEAMQLALICCATGSNLGKLIFARELYKGDIVEQDHLKACEMTKELALLDYPEALCDLGQYCEHGIGTNKNLEYALHFYQKAYDLGLERANILHKNLKGKKGLFYFLFKSEI